MARVLLNYGYMLGVVSQAILFLLIFYFIEDWNEIFRLSARFSGRFSLTFYLLSFYFFTTEFKRNSNYPITKKVMGVFSIVHIIHFIFLTTSIYLNAIPIVITRLVGGILAYLMIVIYPFYINKIQLHWVSLVYFYYVGIVMIMTYVSRVQGAFVGASPEVFHFVALVLLFLFLLVFGLKLRNRYLKASTNKY
ncbi:hypothetical protein OAQ04_03535 [Flavobacteriaceae bacterium]|nr:hypothetical protein [Flavobacteriaceae bacterium]